MRLAQHIAGKSSPKGRQLRLMINKEFSKNKLVNDPAQIEVLKSAAIRGLATYLMMENSTKDKRFMKNVNDFTKNEAESLKKLNKNE